MYCYPLDRLWHEEVPRNPESQGVFSMLATIDSFYTTPPLMTQSSCTGSKVLNVHGCESNSHKYKRTHDVSRTQYQRNTVQLRVH